MKNRISFLKCTDIAENILQDIAGIPAVLPYPVAAVGIGANSNDLAAQLLKPAEVICGGQEAAAAVL